jgi:hypothetical protein
MQHFEGGLGIGQRWRDRTQSIVLRVVGIDPGLHVVEVEDTFGHVETDTIEHFVKTHFAEAC